MIGSHRTDFKTRWKRGINIRFAITKSQSTREEKSDVVDYNMCAKN